MSTLRDRTDAILAASGDGFTARLILAKLLGRLESSAGARLDGVACAGYARRRSIERAQALWALGQVEAAAASVAGASGAETAAAVGADAAGTAGTAETAGGAA